MMYEEPVIIAAAGRGSRLGLGRTKCLVPVLGIPVINYLLSSLRDFTDIRMIVGFQADDVIEHVLKLRPDVCFVMNNNYDSTTTLGSLYLAAKNIDGYCFCVDGDMILQEQSLTSFCSDAIKFKDPVIGIASNITSNPVYADVSKDLPAKVTGFSTTRQTAFEWANIAYIPSCWVQDEPKPFFENLLKYLPCRAAIIDRLEIDTPEDLLAAETCLRENASYCRAIFQVADEL